ncbi:MAG: methyltransferase domain-containing protein [Acidimicrobiia bacterium]|nr:methyltransferase domain-containing protein [Acidimicrobiia bacterium]
MSVLQTARHHVVDQFREPRGPLGRLAGWTMAHKRANNARGRWTVDLLELAPTDRVLELGYGPGVVAGWLGQAVPDGLVVGIDHSAAMQAQAARRNAAAVTAGGLELRVGDAEALPDDLGSFDAACAINVWQFWQDPVATLESVRRHLHPGGRLAVTYMQPMRSARPSDEASGVLLDQLARAGFGAVDVHELDHDGRTAICCLATN